MKEAYEFPSPYSPSPHSHSDRSEWACYACCSGHFDPDRAVFPYSDLRPVCYSH